MRTVRSRVARILVAIVLAAVLMGAMVASASAHNLCYNTGWYQEGNKWYRDTELYYEGGGRYSFQEEWWYPAINAGGYTYFSCYK